MHMSARDWWCAWELPKIGGGGGGGTVLRVAIIRIIVYWGLH